MEYFWFAVVMAAVLVVSRYWSRQDMRTVHGRLARQMAQRGGHLRPAGWLTYPQLCLLCDQDGFMVSAMDGGSTGEHHSPQATFAHIYLAAEPGFDFTITGKSTQAVIDGFLGAHALQTGDTDFDDRFVVRGTDPMRIRRLLDRETMDRLLVFDAAFGLFVSLCRTSLYQDGRLVPDVQRPRLLVSMERIAKQDDDYDWLIETALLLRKRLLADLAAAQV